MTTLALDTRFLADGTAIVTEDNDTDTRYIVWQDDAPESPNEWGDARAYTYCTSYRGATDSADCDLSAAFFRAYDSTESEDAALKIARRYARVILGWSAEQTEQGIITYSAGGYSQSDWWDILAIDPGGYAESHAQTWEQWARGDVYCVMAETRIGCDSAECHGDDDAHWQPGDIISGVYADSAEDAVMNADLSAFN